MLTTLLLDVGPLDYFVTLVGMGLAVLLYIPIFYLSRKGASSAARFMALLLAFVLILLDNWAFSPIMVLGPLELLLLVRLLVFYVPALVVFYKLIQSTKPVKR